ncbi:flagellar motor protein MotB [Variovorax ginsengisoli]|uniref:Chemotaxis protein MotB n=1 Tax=Variovorax ginsengisoli TaxID=363844 RepID=A0ABT9SG06_9BURK|nr:flagellar motor protein MotB [Variovorax ginsengisoli]MDP9902312.1 chemotaxis protein MotB [Variovorax ginsengisoli]
MSAEKVKIIIKRAHDEGGGGHHGGGWKIAYADFMTAMMAFFLVMWLLSIATPKQRAGIAEHFRTPLSMAIGGPKNSNSATIIPGGGEDPSTPVVEPPSPEDTSAEPSDADRINEMKERLEELIDKSALLKQYRSQLLIDITTEGLRLQIVDSENRPMFDLASSKVLPYMRSILRELGPTINEMPNKITLSGHTDSTVYTNGDTAYGNWELSADRANASRRELVGGGMSERKVLRVMGLADSMHLDQEHPRGPLNRRISIILLNRATQERIERENSVGASGRRDQPSKVPPAGGVMKVAVQTPVQEVPPPTSGRAKPVTEQ